MDATCGDMIRALSAPITDHQKNKKNISIIASMTDNSAAMDSIISDFEAFKEAVSKCRTSDRFVAADWQDAYARLARLRERFEKEK